MNSTHPSTMQPMTLSSDTRMIYIGVLILFILTAGCAHYPINDSLESLTPKIERRNKSANAPGTSEKLHVILTFSGGGTGAAAFLNLFRISDLIFFYKTLPGIRSKQGPI